MGIVGEVRRPLRPAALLAALALALLALAALAAAPERAAAQTLSEPGAGLQAEIRRDSYGIPHIRASDWAGIGYGYGYAFAEDNICTIAETYVTVRAERSRYFGPGGSYSMRGNGSTANNLNSDFFYQRIIDTGKIESLLAQAPPGGPRPEIRDGVRGYVAGYNKYLSETGVDNLSDPRCRGAAWVKPISEIDAYRRFYQLALLASGGVAIDGIGGAQPPPPGDTTVPPTGTALDGMLAQLGERLPFGAIGSNAYGLGKEATDNGRGIVLANPHFPWDGPERFYQAQLTIPGQLNVSGASLFGVPIVLIGHTRNMAWSHTVSAAFRFTPFQVKLVPGAPTTYLDDGVPRQMSEDEVEVTVREADGSLGTRERTLYSTRHGPVFNSILGLPLFPWTPAEATAMGDANAENFRYLNHFFETNLAQSVAELDAVLKRNQGIPWVNTIAADSAGKAYYADIGVVPHVTDEKAAACNTPTGVVAFQALRLPVLDGSRSMCNWGTDADAIQPGTFGPSNLPSLTRDDYTSNMNDSYWLTNPEQPIEGHDRIIGDERTARALRTRLGLRILIERLDRPGGPDLFDRQDVQDAVFNNRQYAGELWRDELVAMCQQQATLPNSSGQQVNVSEACPVLAAWNLRDDLDSNGAILFRRFASRLLASVGGVVGDPSIWDVPFSASDPVNTPRGLNTENPKTRQALADAVTDLRGAGIPLNAPLRGYQFERRGSEQIPIHGGPGTVGVFNAINVSWSGSPTNPGYTNVPHGSSFVMVTQFTDGCPDDRSILTYSQSENPASPHFGDQTPLFSQKQWVDPPFCEAELRAEPGLRTQTISGSFCAVLRKGGGGADKLTGTAAGERLRGRAGDDKLRGRGGDDCLRGNGGDDVLNGGRGKDSFGGGAGDDVIRARDGVAERVRCAGGEDRVRADPDDRVRGCETVR